MLTLIVIIVLKYLLQCKGVKTRPGLPPRPLLEMPRPPSGRGGNPLGSFELSTFFCKDDIFDTFFVYKIFMFSVSQ